MKAEQIDDAQTLRFIDQDGFIRSILFYGHEIDRIHQVGYNGVLEEMGSPYRLHKVLYWCDY